MLVTVWCLVSVMLAFYAVPRSLGFSPVTVDGDKADWLGVEPIVNDTGDRLFWFGDARDFRVLRGYDITECYVQVDQDWLYFLFSKKPGGSAGWQLYFDTDLQNQTGYSMNSMGADYRFSEGMDQGMTEWVGNKWSRLTSPFESNPEALHGGWRTTDGLVVDAFGSSGSSSSEAVEWLEGKIAFSVLGSPAVFRLVFQVLPEQDAAPETGYIVVSVREGLRFAASFASSSTRLAYGQRAEPVFRLYNFGSADVEVSSLEFEQPRTMRWVSGERHWNGSVSAGQELVLSSTVEPLVYGWSRLYSVFTVTNPSNNMTTKLSIPLPIVMAPNISLVVIAPENVTLGYDNFMNVTVVNYDPFTVSVNIEQKPWSDILFDNISLQLSPLASVQLRVKITPTRSDLQQPRRIDPYSPHLSDEVSFWDVRAVCEVKATFEDVVLAETSFVLTVFGPEMRIASATVRVVPGNETRVASITFENLGNRAVSLTVSLVLEPQNLVSIRDENPQYVVIPPGNNATVSFQISTPESTHFWGKFSITVDGNTVEEAFIESVGVEPPLSPMIYMLVVAFLVLLAVMLVLNRKWIVGKLSSRRNQPKL